MPDRNGNPARADASLVPRLLILRERAEGAGYMDIADWARCECEGYRADVPAYRKVTGTLLGFTSAAGWLPLPASGNVLAKTGAHLLRQSVLAIEDAIAGAENGEALVHQSGDVVSLVNAASGTSNTHVAVRIDVRDLQSVLLSIASLADRWHAQIPTPTPASPAAVLHPAA